MAITYGFFNSLSGDRTYNADQMSEYFDGLVSDGVYESVGEGLQVVADSGLAVNVKTGRALVDCKWLKNDSAFGITLNAAHVTLNRYTAIVIQLNNSLRQISIVAKDGENATTPTKPTMTDSTSIKELCLAYVYVKAGATSITQADIEDMRPSGLCGWVTGIVKQVDTSELFLQWQSAYEQFYEKSTSDFETWFTALTEELNVNTYIQQYRNIVSTETTVSEIAIGIAEFDPTTDILLANINGVALVEEADYTITGTGAAAKMVLNNSIEGDNMLEFRVLKSKIGQQ